MFNQKLETMKDIEKKSRIQREAQVAWLNAGKRGTLEIITGLGKTKISLDIVKTYPSTARILFLAETTDREKDLRDEQKKWDTEGYEITFACYQSAYKWVGTEWDLVIADEIHDSLTEQYSKFYWNNKYHAILGLSATVDKAAIAVDKGDVIVSKGEMLKDIAPVCFSYNLDQGQSEGTARKLDIYVINHKLDIYNKNIKAGTKDKPFMQTEYNAYMYKDEKVRRAMFANGDAKKHFIRLTANARARLLYELPSKIKVSKKLIDGLPGKTIIFGNSIDALLQITPNVVSSRNNDKRNLDIRESFDDGNTNIIGAFKKLKQGANLVGLDNCILHSYYGKSKDFVQRIGRLRDNGEIGRVFVLVTFGTQEVKWFDNMFEGTAGFNIIGCNSVEDCLLKLR